MKIFAKGLLCAAGALLVSTCMAKPKKVLMIGNSFSICVLKEMPAVCAELGAEVDIVSLYIGGCPLSRHVENIAHPDSKPYYVTWHYDSVADQKDVPFAQLLGGGKKDHANIPEMLKADKWDIVTVQQASHESWRAETYLPYGDELVKTVRELAPQAEIVVQETWSYTPWDARLAKWGIGQDEMYRGLREAYASFAERHGLRVIPMGTAVQEYRKCLPVLYGESVNGGDVCGTDRFVFEGGRWRPDGDVFHLNERGHFLQGLVWAASLMDVDVTKGSRVPAALADRPERARLMREIADRVAGASSSPRVVTSLDGAGWLFDGEPVEVPHTWNAYDSADGRTDGIPTPSIAGWVQGNSIEMNGYSRRNATYARSLPAPQRGRRYFLSFDGVSQKAEVRVNGRLAGRHAGAFTPFVFEITQFLSSDGNWLEVAVDNRYDPDVPPLDADFSLCGGIYRSVKLVETQRDCIDPRCPVRAWPDPKTGEVRIDYVVGGRPKSVVEKVEGFELWTPENPRLYDVVVKEGRDEVALKVGFRTVEMREDGFYLNGKRRKVRGVNRHQDLEGKGWALSAADEERDFRMIKEIGADAVRLAHYPQSENVYRLCDELGLLVWCELPLVNKITLSDDFLSNARRQAREMVEWRGNHPCVAWWGVFNEIYNGSNHMKTGFFEPTLAMVTADIKKLDPSRPVGGVTCVWDRPQLNAIPDALGFNFYPHWYDKRSLDVKLDEFFVLHPDRKVIAMTEYGAGASVNHHQNPAPDWFEPASPFHPEEYQTRAHMKVYSQIIRRNDLWGTFVWAMFDFAADNRNEGERRGINDKGLVTRDRKTRKDSFYMYKANWNEEPMLWLSGKRMKETSSASVDVVAFSNLGEEVVLLVNGGEVARCMPDDVKCAVFHGVKLGTGENRIEVRCGGRSDSCIWNRK